MREESKPTRPSEPTVPFEDPRVQKVYDILCTDESPPEGEHWEGYLSRLIVEALFPPPAPDVWTDWNGNGPCPVYSDTLLLMVRTRSGQEFLTCTSDTEYTCRWDYTDRAQKDWDVVAYKLMEIHVKQHHPVSNGPAS